MAAGPTAEVRRCLEVAGPVLIGTPSCVDGAEFPTRGAQGTRDEACECGIRAVGARDDHRPPLSEHRASEPTRRDAFLRYQASTHSGG